MIQQVLVAIQLGLNVEGISLDENTIIQNLDAGNTIIL